MGSDLLLSFLLVFCNGFFVAAEFAIVKVRSSQLELRVRTGSFLAGVAQNITAHLNAYLSATQLGITLSSLGLGFFSERLAASTTVLLAGVAGVPVTDTVVHAIALPVAFGFVSLLHIVLGELVPKALAIRRSEATALYSALPLRLFYTLFRPFIWIMDSLSNAILSVFGVKAGEEEEVHSPEELRYLLVEGKESGALESEEHELLENVFEFKETEVRQIMVPRTKIAALDISMSGPEIIDRVIDEGYSRLPVFDSTIDSIVGIVFSKDLLAMVSHSSVIILHDVMHAPVYVREQDKISDVLHRMKTEHFHLAVVTDEFGGTAGIVTLEDVIEEIVGDIQDEHDDETRPVEERSDEFLVNAATSIADLNEHLPVALPESDEYDTLGGLLNGVAGRIPRPHESYVIPGYTATIVSATNRMIELVRLVRSEAAEKPHAEDEDR
ncbi:MAG: hemolysin family protein [Candidatus Kapaibacterium sp.]